MTANSRNAVLLCLASAIGLAGCSTRRFEVRDGWMSPVVGFGDIVEVDIAAFKQASPSRWDVVVLRRLEEPGRPLILRVVGLPGETISLAEGELVVDGQTVSAPSAISNIRYYALEGRPSSITSGG